MLMDVAPTILSFAGADPPAQFQGVGLRPLMTQAAMRLPDRLISSETKSFDAGRVSHSIVWGDAHGQGKRIWLTPAR